MNVPPPRHLKTCRPGFAGAAKRRIARLNKPPRPPPGALTDMVAHYRARYGERHWREQSWQRQPPTRRCATATPRF